MNTLLIGIVIIAAFCIWKFVIQPKMNEGKPIESDKDHKTFADEMEEAVNPTTDL